MTLIPTLVTAPTSEPVTLDQVKAHCRVDFADDDDLLSSYISAAVGYLDGWTGVLGRCIMPQTWSVTVDAAGTYALPMPDVTDARIDGVSIELTKTGGGFCFEAEDACTVEFDCEMGDGLLSTTQAIIKFLVAHWYMTREAATKDAGKDVPLGASAMISAIRWTMS